MYAVSVNYLLMRPNFISQVQNCNVNKNLIFVIVKIVKDNKIFQLKENNVKTCQTIIIHYPSQHKF